MAASKTDVISCKGGEKVFSISGCGLKLNTSQDAKPYIDEITQHCLEITEIHLNGNTIGVEAGKAFAAAVNKCEKLKICGFSDMFTGRLRNEIPPILECLGEALLSKESLIHLDLSDNAFGPAGAAPLQKFLSNHVGLQILRLNNNGLGIEGARLIGEALHQAAVRNAEKQIKSTLRVLVAGRNRMENAGAVHLVKALSEHSQSIENISIPQNAIRSEGIISIMPLLSDCKLLHVLDLQDNTFTDEGSKALASVITSWPHLEILNIGDCLLRSKGGAVLIKALTEGHRQLRELHLQYNELNETCANLISHMLKNKAQLEVIQLNGNTFDAEIDAVQAIKDALDANGHPEALDDLDDMEVLSDDEGAEDVESDTDADELADKIADISLKD